MLLTNKVGIQPEVRQHFTTFGSVAIPIALPVNAVQAVSVISAAEIALLNDGDTVIVTIPGMTPNVYTYDAASTVADGEFRDSAELTAHIDAITGLSAADTGAVTTTVTNGGTFGNSITIPVEHLAGTSAGGGATDPGAVTLAEAAIAELAIGDTVQFAGNTYTMAAATDVPANEFEDPAGLEACLNVLGDWGAVLGTTPDDIVITSTADGAEWNGFEVAVTYNRNPVNGANGTPGVLGAICTDGERIYISRATAGLENDSWERSADLTFATF